MNPSPKQQNRYHDADIETPVFFSSSARWIWAKEDINDAWWMFRRTCTLPVDCRDAQLRITAAFHYSLYINGQYVTKGPARSFDFCKLFDTVDVSSFLRAGGENVICILAPVHRIIARRGVLAELTWRDGQGNRSSLVSDRHWKYQRHEGFKADTAGRTIGIELLLGREEWFDARKEVPGWNTLAFDDSSWCHAVELGSANMSPWNRLAESGISQCTDDPIVPSTFNTIELAQAPAGYRLRLTSPEESINATKVFLTELTCKAPTAVRFHCDARVFLDGKSVASDSGAPATPLSAGTHLLTIHQAGYYQHELELLLETQGELSFTAQRILGSSAAWAMTTFPGASMEYPWHETYDSLPVPPELTGLLDASGVAAIPGEIKSRLTPSMAHDGSVSLDVMTQRTYPVGGESAALPSPIHDSHHLLQDRSEAMTIDPTPGYDVHFIVDFDRERIGHVEFTVDAPEGTVIDVQCFETIYPEGTGWMKHCGLRYICRDGMQTYTSQGCWGFRYISVTLRRFDTPVRFHSLRCRQSAYPVVQQGRFECSDPVLNQAYRMSVDTAAVCMLDTYVDCPGHEQNFWVGDARITAIINLLAFGAYDLDERCIRLVGQSLHPEWVQEFHPDDERYTSGRYLPIGDFPNYPEGCLPMWAFQWGLQCWDHWLHGGNTKDLKENYGYLTDMLRRCRMLTNERGLFDMPGAWNLIEWAANDLSPYGEVTANNVMLVQCLRCAADMAKELHLPEEQQRHSAEADERQAAINRLCWNEQRQAYVDTVRDEWAHERYLDFCRQKKWTPLSWEDYRSCLRVSEQTNTLAYLCGCVPEERLDPVKRIIERVKAGRFITKSPGCRSIGVPPETEAPDGIVAVGSPFFLFFSLEALFKMSQDSAAVELMRRVWGDMAAMGYHTCPETFGRARSAAHAWSAAPAIYLPQYVLGVRPLEPGYRTFTVDPSAKIFEQIQWARGSVATPHGPIHVHWQRDENDQLAVTCTCPPPCRRIT